MNKNPKLTPCFKYSQVAEIEQWDTDAVCAWIRKLGVADDQRVQAVLALQARTQQLASTPLLEAQSSACAPCNGYETKRPFTVHNTNGCDNTTEMCGVRWHSD